MAAEPEQEECGLRAPKYACKEDPYSDAMAADSMNVLHHLS